MSHDKEMMELEFVRVQWNRSCCWGQSGRVRSNGGRNENTAGFLLFRFEHLFGYSKSKLEKNIQIQSIVDPYFFLREYYGSFNGYFTLLPPINFLSQLGIDKVHAGDPI